MYLPTSQFLPIFRLLSHGFTWFGHEKVTEKSWNFIVLNVQEHCITSYPLQGLPYLAYDNVNPAVVNSMMLHSSMHDLKRSVLLYSRVLTGCGKLENHGVLHFNFQGLESHGKVYISLKGHGKS